MTDFVIGLLQGALGASVAATLDILDFANRVALQSGQPSVRWRVIGSSRHLPLSNGLRVATEVLNPTMDLGHSVLVIPGLGLDGAETLAAPSPRTITARYADAAILRRLAMPDVQRLAQLARSHHERGGTVCASCSGVLLLGEAGLLTGRRITGHWALASLLQRRYRHTRLDLSSMVIEDSRVITAGATMAQLDLMLHLIKQRAGQQVAESVMRYLLIDSRTTQAHYMQWQSLDAESDDTVSRFEALVEASLPNIIGVAEAASRMHLTSRTLARRITQATGGPPSQLIQAVRMRRAQHLLETSNLAIEEIAVRVGYANATSLRKLTRKLTKLTPALLRRSD